MKCQYPKCMENDDERCVNLLLGICEGVGVDTVEKLTEQDMVWAKDLIADIKILFANESIHDGARFRVAFVNEIMDGYCKECGRKSPCDCVNP